MSVVPRPRLATRLLGVLVVNLALFGVLEIGSRLLPERFTWSRDRVLLETAGPEAMVSRNEVPGWDLDPSGESTVAHVSFHVNQWWMRGPDYETTKGPNVERAIFVGDSSIFGFALEWEQTFSARFQSMRGHRFPELTWEVANCACPGHSSWQSLYKLRHHCLAFEPDYVVLGNMHSDASQAAADDRTRLAPPALSRVSDVLEISAIYRLLRNAWLRRVAPPAGTQQIPQLDQQIRASLEGGPMLEGGTQRVPLDQYEANLREMVRLSQDQGAQVVLLLLPTIADVDPRQPESFTVPYREVMRRLGEELNLPIADGPAAYVAAGYPPGSAVPDLFVDAAHPGKVGALLLAAELDRVTPPPRTP